MSQSELVPLLGEIRDQLKRLADLLEGATNGTHNLNVEIGEPTVRVKTVEPPPKKKVLLDL